MFLLLVIYAIHFIIQTTIIILNNKHSKQGNNASLSDILNDRSQSTPSTCSTPSDDGTGRNSKNNNKQVVLLVIAHPDDEAMFFIPTLQNIKQMNNTQLAVLCLSSGDADGLGKVREKELVESCKHLGIEPRYVRIIDDKQLQDGFDEIWPSHLIARKIKEMDTDVLSNQLSVIITFDNHGISGHPNHISVYAGVKYYLNDIQKVQRQPNKETKNVYGYKLISTNIFRKFSGIFDFPLTWLHTNVFSNRLNCFVTTNPIDTWIAMTYHESQFVLIPYWWRRFFVVLSRYTYVNTLKQITD
jgi:N-acetylglucosaminylphosphatidylinositol deacetylase